MRHACEASRDNFMTFLHTYVSIVQFSLLSFAKASAEKAVFADLQTDS